MDSSSSWIDVDEPAKGLCDLPANCCPLPLFGPNLAGPNSNAVEHASTIVSMQQGLQEAETKAELHRILQSIQCSNDFGVYFCESFRDPRRHYIDDYWPEVCHEALGVQELHRLVGKVSGVPLTDEARTRLHQFARLLDRLARRIDRVVLAV